MLREKARGGWCQMSLVDCFIDAHRAREVERARTQVAV